MSKKFKLQSSDSALLEKAIQVAKEFAQQHISEDIVGIVFLGAIVREYFDRSADIDIAIFKKQGTDISSPEKFCKIDDFEVQCWVADFESELNTEWDMSKRWTYSQGQIYFDPSGKVFQLLKDKTPLTSEERNWLMMSGITLSEWYINRLTWTWVERGNIISAHHMFDQGINYFLDMLFGLNYQLVADMKWRYFCAEKLERLPHNFRERIQDVMIVHSISVEELARRQKGFMEMWEEMKPIIEKEVKMTFDEMLQVV
ncbi:MAG: hypothetical protein C4583_06430 [Anaerolineaceae bacterium]|nr:MAG: hypothetical protein C4583_06430 [Anaerolineaceae bacterium]